MTQKTHSEDTPDEIQNGNITPEQQRFVSELEAIEHQEQLAQQELDNFDPEAEQATAEAEEIAQQEAAQKEADQGVAKITAMGGVAMIEFALKKYIHPDFAFTNATKEYAIENMAPALVKYGALIPEWLMQYEAEFYAAKAATRMISEGIDTAKYLKAAEANDKAEKEAEKRKAEKLKESKGEEQPKKPLEKEGASNV